MAIKYARRRLGLNSSKRKRRNAKLRRRVSFRTTSARTRRVRYRRKARSSTGKLWKYVKKATRSENKRFDAFCPDNPTYKTEKGGALITDLGGVKMAATGRYLTIACADSFHSSAFYPSWTVTDGKVTGLHGPILLKNQGWRMDHFEGHGLHNGTASYQAVGSEIYLKYYSLKLMLHVQIPNTWNLTNYQQQQFELWWIEEKITDGASNLAATNLPHELWDCIGQYFRASSGAQLVTADFEVDGSKPNLKQCQRFNFAFRRKRLDLNTRNVHMKKLYSINVTDIVNGTLKYGGAWNNGTGTITDTATTVASFHPAVITKNFIIPVNRKIKIRDEAEDQRFLNYTYWLLPMDSTLTYANNDYDEVFRAYFTCEAVFTDK